MDRLKILMLILVFSTKFFVIFVFHLSALINNLSVGDSIYDGQLSKYI